MHIINWSNFQIYEHKILLETIKKIIDNYIINSSSMCMQLEIGLKFIWEFTRPSIYNMYSIYALTMQWMYGYRLIIDLNST